MTCYQCQTKDIRDNNDKSFPFCGDICHQVWAKNNYKPTRTTEDYPNYAIEYMKQRLKEMGEEVREKKTPAQKELFPEEVRFMQGH